MSVTPSEIATVIRGEASPELLDRFNAEAADPRSELHRMLGGVAAWAKAAVNQRAMPVPPRKKPAEESYRVVRRAAFWGTSGAQDTRTATVDDLVAYLRGNASSEITALVRKTLEDPSSGLAKLIENLKRP